MQLHQPEVLEELARLNASWLVVSFAPLQKLQRWVLYFQTDFLNPSYLEKGLQLPINPFARTQFAADPVLKVYHAYGLDRNYALKIYGPKIIAQYAFWTMQGKPVRKPSEDPLQRGGNFVLGKDQRLTLAHTGRDQAARPTVQEILAALQKGS